MATLASHSAIGKLVPDFSTQLLGDLQGLLDKAHRFTGATSSAIAFVEGEELVTKASQGDCAPDPGSRSPIAGSFTGLCVHSREVQRCDDASRDPRVDAGACEALGIKSIVMVPIAEKRTIFGVLAAFSPKPNAFTQTHVALLRTLADIVLELRKRYPVEPLAVDVPARPDPDDTQELAPPKAEAAAPNPTPQSETFEPAPAMNMIEPAQKEFTVAPASLIAEEEFFSKPVKSPKVQPDPLLSNHAEFHVSMASLPISNEPASTVAPVKAESKTVEPKAEEPKPAEMKPVEKKALGPVLVKPEPKPQPKTDTPVDLWKREPIHLETESEPAEYARLVTPVEPKKNEVVLSTADDIGPSVVAKSDTMTAPSFGTYGYGAADALARRRRSDSGTMKTILIVSVAAIVTFACLWFVTHRNTASSAATVQAATPQPIAAEPVASVPVAPPVVPEPTTSPVSSASEPPVTVIKKSGLTLPNSGSDHKKASNEGVATSKLGTTASASNEPVVVVNNGSVRKKAVADDVEAPKVATAGNTNVGGLLNMLKTAKPEAAFRSSSITAPQLLKSVAPTFPAFARQMHIQSDRVVLNGTVEKDGTITNIKVVRGKQVFVQPAINAVKQWKYKPALLNGEPTAATIEIVVNFNDAD